MDKPIACRCGMGLVDRSDRHFPPFWKHPESECPLSGVRVYARTLREWNDMMDDTPAMTLAANAMKEKVLLHKRFVLPVRGDGADMIPAQNVADIDTAEIVRSVKG